MSDHPTKYALEGRVVTMDSSFTVFERGAVYVDGGRIALVAPTGAPPPAGFQDAPVIGTRGTIYPGLIDLHNHLSYDALWQVPQLYTNRDQWGRHPDYTDVMALREPLSELLVPLSLDPLTVSDDGAFFGRLLDEPNLPDYVSEGLPALF